MGPSKSEAANSLPNLGNANVGSPLFGDESMLAEKVSPKLKIRFFGLGAKAEGALAILALVLIVILLTAPA